ncbi:MAG: CvpA family protein [Spirosomaceae bacterium]|jgi:membrane protein required for colicin V production|nr:CvpA family protein [Spirosomataceae bacterium]
MNTLDLLMLIPLAWGAFNGYRKGLLIEIVGVAAFVLALIVGFKFLRFGTDLLAPYLTAELTRRFLPLIGFSVIFFPTVFMVNRLGYSLRGMLRYTLLGTLDSVAGAAVGVFTWVFGISVFFWLLSTVGIAIPPKYRQESFLYEYVVPIAPQIISVISDWIPVGGNLIREWSRE